MNGPHDLGGAHGLGPIDPEPESAEQVFHEEWEKRALAVTLAMGALGQWSIDTSRYARERQHPVDYLRNTYYENWMAGLETLLLEKGIVTPEELATGRAKGKADPALLDRVLKAENVPAVLAKGAPADMVTQDAPQFGPGDRVRVRNFHPRGHTRAPRYIRGHIGTIHEHYGSHILPDRSADGEKAGVHLYNVRFEGAEIWGPDAPSREAIYIDLWESYLEELG
ncbi:nitrile hydratase subunit beta [Hwanghaeella grinnelliae]|uniref:Nitrile hydratase subunit beta n=1 Tax=Hwanghaeella grinnelliae TaxID=2500179 RepID=A0A437QPR0_9PROT|nr:nitrile hydratase subunit beta [Hwanghaeella grinnelliae]RVU36516.1 nitrile hydratase subunit beta [Hwanghaeella grinnelliae]